MSDEPVMATTWEQCARHVEAGGVVECARLTSALWDDEQVGPDDYRDRSDAPGHGGYLPRRLVPTSAAPAPESSTDPGEGEATSASTRTSSSDEHQAHKEAMT